MARNILIIGGGPAGVWAAIEAKKQDASAEVVLLTDENCEPYEKPPLSKAVLLGKANPEDALIAGKDGLAGYGVAVRHNAEVVAIDRARREVTLKSGDKLPYDALVLATGAILRELPQFPLGAPRVHYIRLEAHARALKAELADCKSLVVIGAGLIGLEVAASAAELGIKTTVIELAPRIFGRVCDEETAAWICAEHKARGVDLRLGTSIVKSTIQTDGRIALELSSGDTVVADQIVVGTGVKPDDRLAAAAGLEVRDGILADAQCRTSDPAIFAAGDAVRFPGPDGDHVRLENWRHAQDHGAVAGRNAAGASDSYKTTPSFWSEQYDLYIQGVGWPSANPEHRIRRPMNGKGLLVLETNGPHLSYAVGVNAQRDLAAVRRLMERNIPVDPAELADPAKPFNAMLKRS